MTPIEFLSTVWPPADEFTLYCIATPIKPIGMKHRIFKSIQEAADAAVLLSKTENVFFAVHTLKAERVWNERRYRDKKTKLWVPGWSVRTQKNMRQALSFFFDLDVEDGEPAKYQTQVEALEALKSFVKRCKLPRPMVVNSGGGLHIHFVVDRPLASNSEWYTQATRLRQLGLHYGLKIDTTRTNDTASVLRVAGTFNRKLEGTPRPVVDYGSPEVVTPEVWATKLEHALENVEITPAIEKIDIEADELGSNVPPKEHVVKDPPSTEAIYSTCAQMARLRDMHGSMRHNPWWGGLGVLQFSKEGRQAAHDFSAGDPSYSAAEVEQKCDEWKFGPTSCQKLNLLCGPEFNHICVACPHVGKHMGPLSLAKLHEKAPPVTIMELVDGVEVSREIPEPPLPYKRAPNGEVQVLVENSKTGKSYAEVIHPYDLYPVERTADMGNQLETQVWRACLPHGVTAEFTIDATTFVDQKALAARLANNGVYSHKFDALRLYMNSYIQELQRRHKANVQYNHFGWTDNRTEFVLPHGVVKEDGSLHSANFGGMAVTASEIAGKMGTLQRQVELLTFYNDPLYMGQQVVIMAGLASAFFYATGHYGVIVNAHGESGASKSSILMAAASFWGNPETYVINGMKKGATENYSLTASQVLNNLPVLIDEITRMDPERAKDMALGADKQSATGRLDSKGHMKKRIIGHRSNIIISSSNTSLQSLVAQNNNAGQAAAVRVFEVNLQQCKFLLKPDGKKLHEKWEADAFIRELKLNYGHIGEYFIRRTIMHRTKIEERVNQVQKELEIEGNAQSEERFWFSNAAVILVCLDLANKLGLISFNYAAMRHWFLYVQLPSLRNTVREEAVAIAPTTILTNYMEEKDNSILRFNPIDGIGHMPHGALLGQYDMNGVDLVLLKEGFRAYCQQKGLFSQSILKTLLADGVIKDWDKKQTLGAGTPHAKGRSICFTVNLGHPDVVRATATAGMPSNITPKGSSNVVPIRPGVKK